MNHPWQSALLASTLLATVPAAEPNSSPAFEPLGKSYYVVEPDTPPAPNFDDGENPLLFDVYWKDGLYFRTQRDLADLRARAQGAGIRLFESDLKPNDRFLMERFVHAGCIARGSTQLR